MRKKKIHFRKITAFALALGLFSTVFFNAPSMGFAAQDENKTTKQVESMQPAD